jgi:serine phosphatase RsbU (regulator of sigma subunit)
VSDDGGHRSVDRQGYLRRVAEIDEAVRRAHRDPDVMLERAAGLLAGRVGGRIDDARTHLLQLAVEQARDPHDVAAEIVSALQGPSASDTRRMRAEVHEVLGIPRRTGLRTQRPSAALLPPPASSSTATSGPASADQWTCVVQQMLDAMGGRHILVVPVHHEGATVDFRIAAASPSVTDLSGRRGADLLGRRLAELWPLVVDTPAWRLLHDALAAGEPREVGPFRYPGGDDRVRHELILTIRAYPIGPGLLATWERRDEESRLAERLDSTERLGNLGWAEWDLLTDRTVWSDGMYRIHERNPADGPLPRGAIERLVVPEDEPVLRQAAESFGCGETIDVLLRVRVGAGIKHLRVVADAVRDLEGRPLKLHGIVQDITARETSRAQLAEVERQLREHQESLAAEHRLAVQLQHIVLPIPDRPIDLPGLRVAVLYLPAERASRVGGDWYHAAAAPDGSVVLAVGDVAGHGVQAAATMAQLRHALAALVVTTTTDPAVLLSDLNRLLYEGGIWAATATMVLARYHPGTHTLEWAQAGHPAPLLSRNGTTVQLDRPAGPLLGAVRDPTYEVTTTTLTPDDVLVFYTDGLVEQRHHSLAEGLAPIVATLDRITAGRRRQPLADLIAQLDRANAEDDTCILAARLRRETDPSGH